MLVHTLIIHAQNTITKHDPILNQFMVKGFIIPAAIELITTLAFKLLLNIVITMEEPITTQNDYLIQNEFHHHFNKENC